MTDIYQIVYRAQEPIPNFEKHGKVINATVCSAKYVALQSM